jgi:hypothetical protein
MRVLECVMLLSVGLALVGLTLRAGHGSLAVPARHSSRAGIDPPRVRARR